VSDNEDGVDGTDPVLRGVTQRSMQENNSTGFELSGTTASHTQTYLIPGLLTNSLRTVLKTFGGSIYQLTARGSTTTTNRTTVEELRDYGTRVEQRTSYAVSIDYERLSDTSGEPINPLTEDVVSHIFDTLDTHLDTADISVPPDLAVTSVTLRIDDERLAEVTPAQTTEFDLRFDADPAEEALQDRTELVNRGRGLYDELGFNRTHLNLHSVIETATKYTTQSDGRYFNWYGHEDLRPRAPDLLATRINTHILPEEYGILKPYRVVDDQALEIVEDALNDEAPDEEGES
jgi:hypothetical protein